MPILTTGAGKYAAIASGPAFPLLTNLVARWKADAGVTTSSGNVTQVLDQSGNGYHLVNNGVVPFNAASAYNGKPAFDFLAANNAALKTAPNAVVLPDPTSLSVFMVCRLATGHTSYAGGISIATGSGNDFDGAGNATVFAKFGPGNQIQTIAAPAVNMTSNISLDTNMRLGLNSQYASGTGQTTQYINNVVGSAGTNPYLATLTTPTNIVIGNRWISGAVAGSGNVWQGPILEVVVMSAFASSTERSDLDTYFLAQWGA